MLLYIDTGVSVISEIGNFLANNVALIIIIIVVSLAVTLGLAAIPAVIASRKGLSTVGYYFFGVGCLPAAIIVACVKKGRTKPPAQYNGQQYYQQ